MDTISLILHSQAEMESRRSNWESLWEQVARMVLPRSDDFRTKHSPGQQRNQYQYDSFPMAALSKFAAAMEGGLIPRTSTWHRLSTGDPDLDDEQPVKLFLEELNNRLWNTRYSPKANFASQAHENLLSLGGFGTGPMLIEPRPGGGTRYAAVHLSEIYIRENYFGMVDTVHRKFSLSARAAVQLFREKTPDKILEKYNSGKGFERFEFIHCVMPREDVERNRLDDAGLPWAGYYVCVDAKEMVREEGYGEMPYVVPRYATSSREIYGRGPGISYLPDIAMLQEMRRTTIEAANMAVDPPVLLPDDAISEFDLTPGARNYGAMSEEGRELARPWNPNVNLPIGLEMIADTRDQIDDGFLGIYFRVLLQNPNMTATQALLIAQQQGQMTSPAVGRLQTEWLGPMIRRESAILHRQGKHPEMPQRLADYLSENNKSLEIEYVSPLTLAARSEEAVAILRTFESLAPMAQLDPTIYKRFDTGEIADIVADVNGVPARAMKDQEQLEQEEQAEAAQAMLGQVLEAAPVAAETAKTLAEAQNLSQNNPAPVAR